jgi:hypothetical protein
VELLAIDGSTLTALFAAVSPKGQAPLPRAFSELIKRYSFAGFPTKAEDLDAAKVSFRHGSFGDVGIHVFDIYGDGVVVSAKAPTDVLDKFLEDVVQWMGSAFGAGRVETNTINRNYESNLIVRTDAKVLQALDALRPIQEMVAKAVKDTIGLETAYAPFGLTLATDISEIPGLKPIPFRMERRIGINFGHNYYFSSAPLRTEDHLKVLERLEKLVS